jgi:hypothetical protein
VTGDPAVPARFRQRRDDRIEDADASFGVTRPRCECLRRARVFFGLLEFADAKISKTWRRKPVAISIFGCEIRITVMPLRQATAHAPDGPRSALVVMSVPGAVGSRVLQMRTGMPLSTATRGSTIRVRGDRAAEEPGVGKVEEEPATRGKCGGKLRIVVYLHDTVAR